MSQGAPPRSIAPSTFLLVSQVYVPDPASVGQHLAGAAAELAKRGHRVVVITSARGYDNPSDRYPSREVRDGVEIRRVPFASFGKGSMTLRLVGALLFLFQAIVHGLFLKNVGTIVVTTSPPMSAIAAVVLASLKRLRVEYWIMDLNPDQAVAVGAAVETSLFVRAFNWLNRKILSRADNVVVMDRFMKKRVVAKLPAVESRLTVLPPWPLEDVSANLPHGANGFRDEHDLQKQFVVMYSGNHSPANPLTTLIRAAEELQNTAGLTFLFVGGGIGKREVEASPATNIRSLPYQPLNRLRESLSAGDLHVVSIGDAVVGMVHPCKVYGAMAVARPILLFGPPENHVADLLASEGIGWHVAHGDVVAAVQTLRKIQALSKEELHAMGLRAQQVVSNRLGRATLTNALCDVFEGRSLPIRTS
ncbi:MAG: glycosyltransferase family 4 protein [Gemmatimonadaceae bacterium]